jgi:hypothetical protein
MVRLSAVDDIREEKERKWKRTTRNGKREMTVNALKEGNVAKGK